MKKTDEIDAIKREWRDETMAIKRCLLPHRYEGIESQHTCPTNETKIGRLSNTFYLDLKMQNATDNFFTFIIN